MFCCRRGIRPANMDIGATLEIAQIDEVITDASTAAADVAKLKQWGLTVRVTPEDGVVTSAAGLPA
jgi:hypothetical protein